MTEDQSNPAGSTESSERSPQPPPQPQSPPPPDQPPQTEPPTSPASSEPPDSPEPQPSTSQRPWLLGTPAHFTITGLSQSGKSRKAKEIALLIHSLGIGALHLTCSESNDEIGDGARKVSYPDIPAILAGDYEYWDCSPWQVRGFLLELWRFQLSQSVLRPVFVVCDECHMYARKGSVRYPDPERDGREVLSESTIIGMILSIGLKHNVFTCWVSQRPAMVDTNIYSGSRVHLCFTHSENDVLRFKQLGIDFENPEWYDYVLVIS